MRTAPGVGADLKESGIKKVSEREPASQPEVNYGEREGR